MKYFWVRTHPGEKQTVVVKYTDGWYSMLGNETPIPPEDGDKWEFVTEIIPPK